MRPRTYVRYRQLIQLHAVPEVGSRPLARLGPMDLRGLYSQKVQAGLAPRTVGHLHRVLHRALEDAVRRRLVARNVCALVKPPRVPRLEMQVLDPEQVRRLLAIALGDPPEALYVLAVSTGLRQGSSLGCGGWTSNWTPIARACSRRLVG